MDFEKMWYELKQYLIESEETDVLIYMNENEITEVLHMKDIEIR